MIVFAGHGFNYEGESYLCPADYQKERPTESSISVDEVSNVLAESQADGRYLIIDACRNESLSAGEAEFNLRTGLKKLRISQRNSAQGAVVLSSCVPGQQSWEIDQPTIERDDAPLPRQNGVFMHYIMQGLRGAADVYGQQSGFDGIITASPWADVHATASLGIVTLNDEQRKKLGRVERRSAQSLLDQEIAEQTTGDGVMLLVGGDRELRPMATVRFSQAIELSPDLYMPRRLRALLSVLDGNNDEIRAGELYRNALTDMKAVGGPLRIAIPSDKEDFAIDLEIFGPSKKVNGTQAFEVVAKVSTRDVIEVDDIQDASGKTWLKVRRINRWLVDETVGSSQESLIGYIQLSMVARPEGDKAQLQDINRLRKPTAEELRLMNRTKQVAMGSPGLQKAANAIEIAGQINTIAGGNSGVSKGLIYADQGIWLARDIQRMKQEKQQTGRVSPSSIRNAVGRFGF